MSTGRAFNDTVRAEDLVPGDVIVFCKPKQRDDPSILALVVSQDVPATTLVREEAEAYCEPGLQVIAHNREDFWNVTHHFTYALYKRHERVQRNNSVKVKPSPIHGGFLDEVERKRYFKQPEEQHEH